jgi:hypothetical protein
MQKTIAMNIILKKSLNFNIQVAWYITVRKTETPLDPLKMEIMINCVHFDNFGYKFP